MSFKVGDQVCAWGIGFPPEMTESGIADKVWEDHAGAWVCFTNSSLKQIRQISDVMLASGVKFGLERVAPKRGPV